MSDPNLSSFIWSVADLLRGDFKQSEYGRVILPFTVLRRLDCVPAPTKEAVLPAYWNKCAGRALRAVSRAFPPMCGTSLSAFCDGPSTGADDSRLSEALTLD